MSIIIVGTCWACFIICAAGTLIATKTRTSRHETHTGTLLTCPACRVCRRWFVAMAVFGILTILALITITPRTDAGDRTTAQSTGG